MAGVGIWLEGNEVNNAILPLVLMGVEITEAGMTRDYYYTLWTQDEVEIERYRTRMCKIMGWSGISTNDPEAVAIAMNGAWLLRYEYIKVWDMYFPTLRLLTYGCLWRRRLAELLRDMPVIPPFIAPRRRL